MNTKTYNKSELICLCTLPIETNILIIKRLNIYDYEYIKYKHNKNLKKILIGCIFFYSKRGDCLPLKIYDRSTPEKINLIYNYVDSISVYCITKIYGVKNETYESKYFYL